PRGQGCTPRLQYRSGVSPPGRKPERPGERAAGTLGRRWRPSTSGNPHSYVHILPDLEGRRRGSSALVPGHPPSRFRPAHGLAALDGAAAARCPRDILRHRRLQHLQQAFTKSFQLALFLDLRTEGVVDVEAVHRSFAKGRDLRAIDDQILPGQNLRDRKEEAGTIAGIHLHHRVAPTRPVVDQYPWRDDKNVEPRREAGNPVLELLSRPEGSSERLLDRFPQALQLLRILEGPTCGIANVKGIQRHAI